MPLCFEPNQTVLFQGDSITDAGRSREDDQFLGGGYAMMSAAWISAARPELNLRFLNRGISGNRVRDLRDRWDEDCIALRPDWVSILIGINDTWRRYDQGQATTTETFEADYRELLVRVRDETGARLILCEPFVLPTPADRERWRKDLDPKIDAVRKLARQFATLYVPFDGTFAAAAVQQPPAYWADDGVHPSHAGHALMARTWLRTVGAI